MTIGVRASRGQINHGDVVKVLKTNPGKWTFIGHFGSRHTAASTATQIRNNRYSPAYAQGHFDTYYAPDLDEGFWELWVKYDEPTDSSTG